MFVCVCVCLCFVFVCVLFVFVCVSCTHTTRSAPTLVSMSMWGWLNYHQPSHYICSIDFEEIPPDVLSGHDVFEVETGSNGTLAVRGNSAVSMASGLYWYLKRYCNSQVTWGSSSIHPTTQQQRSSSPPPLFLTTLRVHISRHTHSLSSLTHSDTHSLPPSLPPSLHSPFAASSQASTAQALTLM